MKTKILIVDDEVDVRDLLVEYFSIKGFNSKGAIDGKDGLKVYKSFKPQLAIVDIAMPNMDGVAFAREIFKNNPDFPIVMVTGFSKDYNIENILQMGVKEVIKKPLNLHDLLDSVNKYISG